MRVVGNALTPTEKISSAIIMLVPYSTLQAEGIHMDMNSLAHTKWNCKVSHCICTKVS